jgi:hypothetical protein
MLKMKKKKKKKKKSSRKPYEKLETLSSKNEK